MKYLRWIFRMIVLIIISPAFLPSIVIVWSFSPRVARDVFGDYKNAWKP